MEQTEETSSKRQKLEELSSITTNTNNLIDKYIDSSSLSTICVKCRIDFINEENLRSHYLKFKKHASFQCELCHKSFIRNDILQEHQRVHINESLYKCVKCFYSCDEIYDIYEHIYFIHKYNIDNIFKCPYDDIMFRSKNTLFQHINYHHIPNNYKELINETDIKIKEELDNDNINEQTDNVSRYVNDTSNYNKSEPTFNNELLKEIDESTLIDVEYIKNETLIKTIANKIETNKLNHFNNLIKCAYCLKLFNYKNDLKLHLINEHDLSKEIISQVNIDNEKFECKICNIKYDFSIDLKHHNSKEHTKYECTICKKVYNQSHTLRKHMQSCSIKTNYTDDNNQGTSGKNINVNTSSTTNKIIICTICEKTFKRNWNLKQHMLKIHKINKDGTSVMTEDDFSTLVM